MPGLSYAHGASATPLLGETIGERLSRAAREHPDREAVVSVAQGVRLTYAELDAAVDRIATGLLGRGIAAGDRVGVWAPNCVEWLLAQYATARVGAILVNVNPAYRTHELAYCLEQSGVRLLLSAPAFKTSDYRAMVQEVAPGLPDLEEATFFGDPAWKALAARPRPSPQRSRSARPGSTATSPSTSSTRAARRASRRARPSPTTASSTTASSSGSSARYTEQDRICVPVPFYHCFGMVMGNLAALTHGACVVIPAPAFDPAATLAAVAAERCTSLYGVPTMFIAMLGDPGFAGHDLTSLRTGIMAGSPCPEQVMRRVVEEMHMGEVSICYGMTETSPVSTQTRREDPLERRVGSIGRVGPHVEVKVIDAATGVTVPRGATGELCTRGYSVMLGYWDDPVKTAGAKDAAGWMHTGDLATMDDEGYLNVVGRSKDMVIRGGENVYPREVEEFLTTHPDIADVQVVGVPDERYGEELCAWVQLRPGAPELEAEALRAFCAGKLAHFKVPRYVLCVGGVPAHGHGEGPQGRDARGVRRAPRPAGRRGDPDGLRHRWCTSRPTSTVRRVEPAVLLAYAGAWGALAVLPGPDTALTLKHAVVGGRAPAVRASLGSMTALLFHVLAAGLGLSAIIAQSAAAFTVVKLLGAGYLGYLGLRLILARTEGEPDPDEAPKVPRRGASPYQQGVLTGLLNPKSALFFLTFLPQFLDPDRPVAGQLAILAPLTVGIAALWLLVVIGLAGRARQLAERPRVQEVFQRLTGTAFVVLATRLAGASH